MSALVDALYAPSSVDAALVYDTFSAASSSAASFLFDNAAAAACCDAGIVLGAGPVVQHAVEAQVAAPPPEHVDATTSSAPRRKRRRRARSCKSKEEAESQRVTHIAVERNRRRQMNEYLAVLRSLMPEAYVQRGDQASIVGGAIEFVKELEQQLQSLEARKRTLLVVHHQHMAASEATPTPTHATPSCCAESAKTTSNCSSSSVTDEDQQEASDDAPPFARFFTCPQYVRWCQHHRPAPAEDGGGMPGVADVEVSLLVETHASVRVMAPRRPGQLLKMVTGLQALRLAVLHLTVTTLDSLALYSISVKVEEGCGLTTTEHIAAAVHHVLCIVDADATAQRLLDRAQALGH